LLLEELTTTAMTPAVHRQHAIQIIDHDNYWKTREKVDKSTHIPIIVYNTEWQDEQVQNELQPNLENAERKYPKNIEYEQVKINLPESILSREQYEHINQETTEQFVISYNYTDHQSNEFLRNMFATQHFIDNDEEVSSLSDDSFLKRHKQRSDMNFDEPPSLENPLRSSDILILNYAQHNQELTNEINAKQEDEVEYSLTESSSSVDMETFLTYFEESLDHEQRLPFINQISLSYATANIERNKLKNRALPIEWFKPTILTHDEQLVEQWTIENDIDTIQQEGTLHRQKVESKTNIQCVSVVATATNQRFEDEKSSSLTLTDNRISHVLSHCSPTSDYETDSLDKDNDITSTTTAGVIIPVTNILPSSSTTNTTLLSQSSLPLTSYTSPVVPIVYFLDALAVEQKEKNSATQDFLLTIGFGQSEIGHKMNAITNTVSNVYHPLRATWVNRPTDKFEILPTTIHRENETLFSPKQQQIHIAIENELEEDDTALLIHPHRLQYGHDLGENVQGPLSTYFEPAYLHLPVVTEVFIYQMSFHNEFPLFHPPDSLPHILVPITQYDEILSPNEYQINQHEILSFAREHDLSDNEEDIQNVSFKLDQPTYIEHYHVQSLHPFSETCYAQIQEPPIIIQTISKDLPSIDTLLPDIIPIKTKVIHLNTIELIGYMHVYLFDQAK
jgi:hypothetical protein